MGFNAEPKEFDKWLKQYSNEDPADQEAREIERSANALAKFFGGS